MDFKNKSIKSTIEDMDKGVVKIMVNSFNVKDAHKEISQKGSFKKTIKEQLDSIKHLYNHFEFIGLPLEMYENEKGLVVVSKLNIQNPRPQEIYNDYKFFAENGKSLQHSVAVRAEKYTVKEDSLLVHEWKMREYSTVLWGANPNTPQISVKSDDNDSNIDREFMQKYLKELLNAEFTEGRLKSIQSVLDGLESQKPSIDTFDASEIISKIKL